MLSGKADCGLQYAVRKSGSAVAYCALSIRCGTRDEKGWHSGIAHFIEHTIFKGTKRRSASVINGYLDRLGGELNAFTTKEEIVFHATVLKEDLGKAVLLPAGHQLNQATLLFGKIEDEVVDAQIARLEAIRAEREAAAKAAEAAVVTPQKEECTFDDFGKMDIRTATVLEAERVPKTDKLLKLTIDTGIDKRVIVSGIAEQYSPEEMVGKQICILANLAPRKIRGIESKGMILMARQNDGKMRFITPQETLCNGAEIG